MTATLERPETGRTSDVWEGFEVGLRRKEINVRAFIQRNDSHEGGGDFRAAELVERTVAMFRNDGLDAD